MITRNNETTIAAAVGSIKPHVDQIVVVDTGSTDRTVEICRSLGCEVYHFPWPDSFSVARNESLKYARGQWIIWIDSDDEADAESCRRLLELLKGLNDPKILGLTMQVHCPAPGRDGGFDITVVDHCKVFRNRPDIRFEGRIHEQVLAAISRAGGEVAYTPFFVVHAGADDSPAGRRRKLTRDFRLLRMELKEQPGQTFTLFNLGMTFADAKRHRKAVRALERSLASVRPNDMHLRKIYALLASSLKELGRPDEALRYCRDGLALFPKDPELHFRSGLLLHDAGRLRQAELEYLAALAKNDELHFASLDRGITGFKSRQNLAAVYSDMGAAHKAEEQWRTIVREVPGYRYAWQALADNLLEQNKLEAAAQLADGLFAAPALRSIGLTLGGLLAERRGDLTVARQLLADAVEQSQGDERPLEELARVLFHHGSPDEAEAALTRLVRDKPADASVQHNLAIVYLRQGRNVEATLMLRSSLQLRPESAATRHLLECAESTLAGGN
jgi:glycosyltransferase involved in cell wall biosynthesis